MNPTIQAIVAPPIEFGTGPTKIAESLMNGNWTPTAAT